MHAGLLASHHILLDVEIFMGKYSYELKERDNELQNC